MIFFGSLVTSHVNPFYYFKQAALPHSSERKFCGHATLQPPMSKKGEILPIFLREFLGRFTLAVIRCEAGRNAALLFVSILFLVLFDLGP